MGLFDKLFHGAFYVVDEATLKKHLEDELSFSIENSLQASANLYIYLNSEKHHIEVTNFQASEIESERQQGLIVSFDDEDFASLPEMYAAKLSSLPQYFKIELIDMDSVFLNEYKENHPELKIDEY